MPPAGAAPRVRFDRGRVAVTDRAGRTLLDLGGFAGGAVAQIVTAGDYSGLWIKPLSADGSAPAPADLHLDHGDVAFVDANGVALAMSTERDTVVGSPIRTRCRGSPSPNASAPGSSPACGCSRPPLCC